jgi:hypothetical protein
MCGGFFFYNNVPMCGGLDKLWSGSPLRALRHRVFFFRFFPIPVGLCSVFVQVTMQDAEKRRKPIQ